MDFTEYIKPELLILIPVLYIIGMAAKKTSLIANKLIPLIVGTIGILLSVIYVLATTTLGSPQLIAMAIFTALTQGVLTGGASVYANQIFKQFKNNSSKDSDINIQNKNK
ncbi:MAG: phage holin family protein [Clostridium sp.]|nr:phage holin family protein [Clostridium sp.]